MPLHPTSLRKPFLACICIELRMFKMRELNVLIISSLLSLGFADTFSPSSIDFSPLVTPQAVLPRQETQDSRFIGFYLPTGTLSCNANFFYTTAVFFVRSTSSTIATCLPNEQKTDVRGAEWWVDCTHRINGTRAETLYAFNISPSCLTIFQHICTYHGTLSGRVCPR
ncbi:uncharacterized protein BDR25DRAFT_15274 [Lindgomyces ingoldianus]|uniref:Uncharacterized protein n=1 Tax=Lindgomyces ingoldianus TaxID=673940 RepID=A0ACB6R148_9PLEO|nr:uncharacterized protein BDR25DRAFT_15274 [Lindgomyces ingoldianus]KAF2472553.1 hypothetical protein BDR25DRAFT_15274 [Lindgomyces ingoldianus]